MKNKIIALFLAVVMTALTLVSCSESFSYAEENFNEYFEVVGGVNDFKAKFAAIEIADGSFTTNEETRNKKVEEAILATLASYAEKNGEKNTSGTIDTNDTLYYAYYISYDKDNDGTPDYLYDVDTYMAETSSPKSSVKFSAVDVDDEEANKQIAIAIKKAITDMADKSIIGYKTNATKNTKITKDAFKAVYVSYSRSTGEGEAKQVSVANAVKIDLHATGDSLEAKLAALLTADVNKDKVAIFDASKNNYVEFAEEKVKEDDPTTFSKVVKVTDTDGTVYEYSNFKILFAVENEGKEFTVTQTLSAKKELKTTDIDNLHAESDSYTIPEGATVTYHIFPVYYYSVSDISARSILIEALADKISAASFEVFEDEGYKMDVLDEDGNKTGDKTLKALVEELVAIYKENTSAKIKELKTAYDTAEAAVTAAKTNLDKAIDALNKAGESDLEELTKAKNDAQAVYDKAVENRDTAKTKYETAKDAAANKIDEILKVTKEGDEAGIAAAIVKEYKEDQYHNLKETYDKEITDKLAKAIWELIDKNVVSNGKYPEQLVEEAKDHLYNQYEYEFYNDTVDGKTGSASIYSAYNGVFDDYLVKITGAANIDGVDAKIDAKAKEAILPIMKVYFVAKMFEEDAELKMPAQIEENKFAYLEEDGTEGLALDVTRHFASNFYLDDEAFEEYKELVGKKDFENSQDYYGGETNIRAAIQFTNLFDYLLMSRRAETGEGDHKHAEIQYTEDGKLHFYNIGYVLKDSTESK